jgi:hypothetical protein
VAFISAQALGVACYAGLRKILYDRSMDREEAHRVFKGWAAAIASVVVLLAYYLPVIVFLGVHHDLRAFAGHLQAGHVLDGLGLVALITAIWWLAAGDHERVRCLPCLGNYRCRRRGPLQAGQRHREIALGGVLGVLGVPGQVPVGGVSQVSARTISSPAVPRGRGAREAIGDGGGEGPAAVAGFTAGEGARPRCRVQPGRDGGRPPARLAAGDAVALGNRA